MNAYGNYLVSKNGQRMLEIDLMFVTANLSMKRFMQASARYRKANGKENW